MAEEQIITNSGLSSTSSSTSGPVNVESLGVGAALAAAATPVIADAAVTVMAVSAAPVLATAAVAAVVTTAVAAFGVLANEAYIKHEQNRIIADQINLRNSQQQVATPELSR